MHLKIPFILFHQIEQIRCKLEPMKGINCLQFTISILVCTEIRLKLHVDKNDTTHLICSFCYYGYC